MEYEEINFRKRNRRPVTDTTYQIDAEEWNAIGKELGKLRELLGAGTGGDYAKIITLEPEQMGALKADDAEEGILYLELGSIVTGGGSSEEQPNMTWKFGGKFPVVFGSGDGSSDGGSAEQPEETWKFGGKFPIVFDRSTKETWRFGNKFPLIFKRT